MSKKDLVISEAALKRVFYSFQTHNTTGFVQSMYHTSVLVYACKLFNSTGSCRVCLKEENLDSYSPDEYIIVREKDVDERLDY